MKEMLRNKSRELDDFKHQKELDSCNRCFKETKVLDCKKLTGMEGILNKELHYFCIDSSSQVLLAAFNTGDL